MSASGYGAAKDFGKLDQLSPASLGKSPPPIRPNPRLRCAQCGEYQDESPGSCVTVETVPGEPHLKYPVYLGAHVWVEEQRPEATARAAR